MNENKEIKKLSETGEQSAEKVAGGKDVKSLIPDEITLNRLNDKFYMPIALRVYGRHYSDCGKKCSSIRIFNGKEYCESCCRKHAKESQNTSEKPVLGEKSLSENDLSQVSGGGMNEKILENICKYKDHEYTCRLCGKTFIRRDPTGLGVAMRPRPVKEIVYCDKCLSKIRDTF